MAAGLFGVFGYDVVRLLEPLGAANPDPLDLPDAVLTRPSLVAIFDSVKHEIVLVAAAYPDAGADPAQALTQAQGRLDAFEAALAHAVNYHGVDSGLGQQDIQIAAMLVGEVYKHLLGQTDVQVYERMTPEERAKIGQDA